jgi:predicted metal-dependent phosphoesterase TrpH
VAVDLHLHSTRSDGTDRPAAIVAAGAAAGLAAIALTDHDTLDGIAEAEEAAARHGIRLIPGTELSVDGDEGPFHLLVYHLSPRGGPLQNRLRDIRQGRHERNLRIVLALRNLGIEITYDEIAAEAVEGQVGRPHVAAVLVRKGVVPDLATAFDRYLARGRPAYDERYRLDHREAVSLAVASGAVPVVAHPHTLGVTAADYERVLTGLAADGVMGVEAHYADYAPEVRRHLARLAASLGMIATGGSDYHGRYKPDLAVGTGRGDLAVPDEVVEHLDAARATLPRGEIGQ